MCPPGALAGAGQVLRGACPTDKDCLHPVGGVLSAGVANQTQGAAVTQPTDRPVQNAAPERRPSPPRPQRRTARRAR